MTSQRAVAGVVSLMVWMVAGCSEPTTIRESPPAVVAGTATLQQSDESAAQPLGAHELLMQQLAWNPAAGGGKAAAPSCTILRAYSPALGFDRTARIGNCGACVAGNPSLAVATSGAGAAGNTAEATARCSGVDVSGTASVGDPGLGGVNLNASAGIQTSGVPECTRNYRGVAPQSNRSFTCIFF